MPSAEQLRSRLLKKLSELFQLDQPDLDFGFYRIMHAKAQEVQDFIGTDLLKIVADAVGDVNDARKVEGWVPKDAANPNNGRQEKVLVVWRKLTDDIEQDNLMLDEWFQKNRIRTRDFEFDTIYVNGSNNLPNLKRDEENWKVRLIEEEFMKKMWEAQ